ncbi:sigma-70 family RNA polymerase sigma factor [uncultured Aquimarina sp.]|uniref:RNA polymerase sigma factor n=1 Tax=uncultured Aquimarina sp. TaxID=575652 RepID=UPI002639B004|nr:sigma-70 family RNA polymerase sigma factor [uncultured Aquimarina sp.]
MNKKIIKALIDQNEKVLTKFYYANLNSFSILAKKCRVPENVIKEIYHDAFMDLRKKAISGYLNNIKSSIEGYLYGIGKNLIKNYFKQKKDIISLVTVDHLLKDIEEISFEKKTELSLEQILAKECILKLGPTCQKIIRYCFDRGLDNKEISEKLNIKFEAVSPQKSRCLKKLRKCVQDEK